VLDQRRGVLETLKDIMGIIRQGIFGGFEGKTGPLVGRRTGGKNMITAIPHPPTGARTQAQMDQQLKFELVSICLKGFKDLIAIGFVRGNKNTFNAAMKYNFSRIVRGTSPDYGIDYTRLVYSKGSLAGPNIPMVSLGLNLVSVSWLPETQHQFSQDTDKAQCVVYCPDKALTIIYRNHAVRAALGCSLAIPLGLNGDPLYVYMSFVSANGRVVSNSIYLGVI
jgi:hypothetical protein